MSKKFSLLFLLMACVSLSGVVSAAEYWDNDLGDNDFNKAANWQFDVLPDDSIDPAVELIGVDQAILSYPFPNGSVDDFFIALNTDSEGEMTIEDPNGFGDLLSIKFFHVGYRGTGTLHMDGGSVSTDQYDITLSIIVVIYTMAGGLWAVLVTGVLQFVVLMAAVLLVLPLAFVRVGNLPEFVQQLPTGFLQPTAPDMEYTWFFLGMWAIIHVFVWGSEWQFVQRYVCVPTIKEAKKTAYIIGVLYLFSPIIWMLPPLLYRGINAGANHEEAYILMCKEVLPVGMLGLMIAAMLSATSSTVASVINVYAGAYTYDMYYTYIAPKASERHLVWAGRVITVILGLILISSCLIISRADVTKFVIMFSALLYTPWLLPTLWGLFSKRIGQKDFWITVGLSMLIIIVFMVSFNPTFGGLLRNVPAVKDSAFISYFDLHPKTMSLILGNIPPVVILVILQLLQCKKVNPGWDKVQQRVADYSKETKLSPESLFPAKVIAWSLGILGLAMIYVTIISDRDKNILGIFTGVLIALSVILFILNRKYEKKLISQLQK